MVEMPVATDHRTPTRRKPGTAPRFAELAAMLSDAGREDAPTPGDPECIQAVRCAIRHLEELCADLSTAAVAIAHAATRDAAGGPFAAAPPAAQATAWRLYDASHALRAAGQACAAAAAAAERLEPATDQRGR